MDYKDKLIKTCDFSSLEEFAYLMKKTLYGKINNVFSNV
jgi:hypothetical protein